MDEKLKNDSNESIKNESTHLSEIMKSNSTTSMDSVNSSRPVSLCNQATKVDDFDQMRRR